jgi:hypothetical protein
MFQTIESFSSSFPDFKIAKGFLSDCADHQGVDVEAGDDRQI